MIDESFLKELQEIKTNQFSAVEACKNPGTKFFNIRQKIYSETNFLPEHLKTSDRIYCILNNITTWPKLCKCGCGTPVSKLVFDYVGHHSNDASEVKQKMVQSTIKRFGVENASQSVEIKKKKEDTFQKNFGTTHYMKNEEAKQKHFKSFEEKHGVDNPWKLPTVIEDIKKKWQAKKSETLEKSAKTQKRHFFENLTPERLNNNTPLFAAEDYDGCEKKYAFMCNACQKKFLHSFDNGRIPIICPFCKPKFQSNAEIELLTFIGSLGLATYHNERQLIGPYEIDIHVPSKNIGIEFNGIYWHSEESLKTRLNFINPKEYHLFKTLRCQDKNTMLIHVFEDEWTFKKQIVKSRLKTILGCKQYKLDARKCQIRKIDAKTSNRFIEKYHIQGKDNAPIRLGLFLKNRLVAVMTFCKNRIALGSSSDKGHELSRFCTISNFNIRGAAGKLLTYFENNFNPKMLTTYADRRWSIGMLYEKLGFTLDHISKPNYWYIAPNSIKRLHRWNFRKSQLPKLLGEHFDPNKTEQQLMKENNYNIIWDCGNLVYIKKYNEKCK